MINHFHLSGSVLSEVVGGQVCVLEMLVTKVRRVDGEGGRQEEGDEAESNDTRQRATRGDTERGELHSQP